MDSVEMTITDAIVIAIVAAAIGWMISISSFLTKTHEMMKQVEGTLDELETKVHELNKQVAVMRAETNDLLAWSVYQEREMDEHVQRIHVRIDSADELFAKEMDSVAEMFALTNKQLAQLEKTRCTKSQADSISRNLTAKISAVAKQVVASNDNVATNLNAMRDSFATKTYVDFRVRGLGRKTYEMLFRITLGDNVFYNVSQRTGPRVHEIIYMLNETFYNINPPSGPFNPDKPPPNPAIDITDDIYLD
jgi:uncharacterized protein YoxC